MAEFDHRPHGWPQARRFVVARRFIPEEEPQTTLFTLGRYLISVNLRKCISQPLSVRFGQTL